MRSDFRRALVRFAVLAATVLAGATASATPVAMELVLALDVSGSVSSTEWTLQRDGYVAAFRDPTLQNLIVGKGGIAVTLVQWSGASQRAQTIAWTLVNSPSTANTFANLVASMTRPFSGLTAIGSAINYSVPLFNNNGFEGGRLVIDISGDGTVNDGASVTAARDAAAALGIYINGLPILNEVPTLESYYRNNVITGTGSFTVPATNYTVFAPAILQKLRLEVNQAQAIGTGVPEPGTLGMGLAGLGLLALACVKRQLRR